MQPFLKSVADDLLRRFPDGMQRVAVIFPGKRARLFLNDYIVQASGHPVWAPASYTMQELFASLSPYSVIDPIEAVCTLHRIYRRHLPDDGESLDQFYGWGHVLLSDFDDIDKHLVDAHALFANIMDLEELTSDNYLSEEQEETLRRFFAQFTKESNTQMRERFRRMWRAMSAIYDDFVRETKASGCVTESVMYRDVIERIGRGEAELPSDVTYAFVGLNALSEVERRLMHTLQGDGRALFYWDYDRSFLDCGHEAGIFMESNLREFPNALPGTLFDNLRPETQKLKNSETQKLFTYIATAGMNVQARYIPTWLQSVKTAEGHAMPNTAIVLCDETLLEPVLHAIPDAAHGGPSAANITMGYPMTSTPIYSLLRALMNLHTNGWDARTGRLRTYERRLVENHPIIRQDVQDKVITVDVHREGIAWLVKYLRDMLEFIAGRQAERAAEEGKPLDKNQLTAEQALASESVFRAYTVLQHIEEMVDRGVLHVSAQCLCSVIDQALSATSIPFHGEPAEGLQVMGILETRCLDFDNILMLSVGEGKMPRTARTPSFIPYSLRRPFGLTTIEHRVGVEAYYFYRLLERAKNVAFVYDTANADGVKNEMSRFLRQLLVEMRPEGTFPDSAISIKPDVSLPRKDVLVAKNTPAVLAKLCSLDKISPTALEEYVECPLKYYLHYVGNVKEYVEQEDEMDSATFGNIFHSSAEEIYRQFIGRPMTHDDLRRYIGDSRQAWRELQYVVDRKMDEHYFQPRGMTHECIDGALAIRRDVITRYLANLIAYDDRSLDSETREVVGCELQCKTALTLSDGRTVAVGGTIDRLDRVTGADGTVRLQIIDYKTMSRREPTDTPKADMDMIFAQEKKYLSHIFQTFIYALAILDRGLPIQPTVFYTQDSSASSYSTQITFGGQRLDDFRPLANEFRERLTALVENIFNGEQYAQTSDKRRCAYCPFAEICRL